MALAEYFVNVCLVLESVCMWGEFLFCELWGGPIVVQTGRWYVSQIGLQRVAHN